MPEAVTMPVRDHGRWELARRGDAFTTAPWRKVLPHDALAALMLLGLLCAFAVGAEGATCRTREDPQFQRWVTTCTDGSRAATRYDRQFKNWRTDVVMPGKAGPEAEKGQGKR